MNIKRLFLKTFFAVCLALPVLITTAPESFAQCCNFNCEDTIVDNHERIRNDVNQHTSDQFTQHRNWFLNTLFRRHILPALMMMTEQMSAVAMQQTMIIGTFLDAKHQLETQRLFQELQAQAHKDYQPSEDFCWFGTNVRSLANTESMGRINALMLSRRQMARHLGQKNIGGANSADQDKEGRWRQFTEQYCDPQDNNWMSSQPASSGLHFVCGADPTFTPEYTNADIDYTRLVDNARTITLLQGGFGGYGFLSPGSEFGDEAVSVADMAVMALGNNLYGHNVLTRTVTGEKLSLKQFQDKYLNLRSIAARRSVAENSYNAIVGMKSAGSTSSADGAAETRKFLGAIMVELGVPANEVTGIIGSSPSYYAQLEILAKKIYQSPDFYSNLYDTPTNIKRKQVALKAIELMLDRAIYESQIRQEMAASVLLSSRLKKPFDDLNTKLGGAK